MLDCFSFCLVWFSVSDAVLNNGIGICFKFRLQLHVSATVSIFSGVGKCKKVLYSTAVVNVQQATCHFLMYIILNVLLHLILALSETQMLG